MFTTISNEIETILNGIVASTKLAAVFNYDVKTYSKFPTATISVVDGEQTLLDTATNDDNINFRIRIVDQNRSIATMEARMRLLIDNVLTTLRTSNNLNNTVCRVTFSIVWWWIDDSQPMRSCDITCHCLTTNAI